MTARDHSQQADPLVGSMIGSYRCERLIGEGGMGAVYALVHPELGRRMALKVLHAEYVRHRDIVSRLFDEGRAACRIGHPNIIDVFDNGRLPDGRAYLVMEYLAGESLSSRMRRQGVFSPDEVKAIVLPVCSALGAAHRAGIVHRDLKPGNIFLVDRPDNPRFVKVVDFGIAKLDRSLTEGVSNRTRSGLVLGTPRYMSPEQALGHNAEVDLRTDVYATGVILFQMLTGKVPFDAEAFGDLMLMHASAPRPRPSAVRPGVAAAWDAVVARALARAKGDRFGSMEALAEAVSAACRAADSPAGEVRSAVTPSAIELASVELLPVGASGPTTLPDRQPLRTAPGEQERGPIAAPVAAKARPWLAAAAIGSVLIMAAVVLALLLSGRGGGRRTDVAAASTGAPAAGRGDAGPGVAQAPVDAGPPLALAPPIDAAPIAILSTGPDAAPATPGAHASPAAAAAARKAEGELVVVVTPWSRVEIDGVDRGLTPATLRLPAGRHRLVLTNPELGKRESMPVVVRPGKTTSIRRAWTYGPGR